RGDDGAGRGTDRSRGVRLCRTGRGQRRRGRDGQGERAEDKSVLEHVITRFGSQVGGAGLPEKRIRFAAVDTSRVRSWSGRRRQERMRSASRAPAERLAATPHAATAGE